MSRDEDTGDWLVLAYQFPKGPGARRVKVWRRLQTIGAVAIKNSVYVLPVNDQSREDFAWLLAELRSNGADGAILESRFVDGMTDRQVRELFNAARAADYQELEAEIGAAVAALPAGTRTAGAESLASARRALTRARNRLAEIEVIDFFAAKGHDAVETALRTLDERTTAGKANNEEAKAMSSAEVQNLAGRVWVTRRGVRVDRIASAWLILRWIDADARFKFVPGKNYSPQSNELRFDMFEAEFTHVGDRCTFEVLAKLANEDDTALRRVGEIVHDIDLKDGKFGHPETAGVASLLEGIVAATDDDERRLFRGGVLFEDLYRSFGENRA